MLLNTLLVTPLINAKEYVIFPLGDSITKGVTGYVSPNEPVPGGYRGYLNDLLVQEGVAFTFVGNSKTNPSLNLTKSNQENHEGHPGWVIELLTYNLENWLTSLNKSPDIILLMAGTNNLGLGEQTPEEAGKHMDILLNEISSLMPNVITIVSTLIPYNGTGATALGREANQVIFNIKILPAIIINHQKKMHKVVLFDMRNYFNMDNEATHLSGDKVHPSALGYQAIANGWFQALKEHSIKNNKS